MSFAQELKAWRAKHRLTQAEAAERLGVSLRTYEGWEQGRGAAHKATLRKLMAVSGKRL